MKQFAFLVIASLAFTSCYHAEDSVLDTSSRDVNFRIQVEGLTQEALTRASTPALDTPTKLLILDRCGTTVTNYVKTSFNDLSLPLKLGVHDLYFVATPKDWASFSSDDLTVTWPNDGTMKAVWAYHYQLDVVSETTFEDLVLPLAVADVRLGTLDKLPAQVQMATVEAPDVSTVLDLTTMTAGGGDGYTRTINVAANAGKNAFAVNIYTFVPESSTVGDISLAFYSDTDLTSEVASRDISGVQVKAGYVSNYTGYFFTDGLSIPVTYTTEWLGVDNYSY